MDLSTTFVAYNTATTITITRKLPLATTTTFLPNDRVAVWVSRDAIDVADTCDPLHIYALGIEYTAQ